MDKRGFLSGGAVSRVIERLFHSLWGKKSCPSTDQAARNEELQRIAKLIERGSFTRCK